jgi:hypothetical protein
MESAATKKGKLEQFRVSIALLIAGVLFLLGIGVMSMVLNNVESLQFSLNTNRLNTRKLSSPDTAFEYVVSFLNDNEHRELPFSVNGKPLKELCEKVVGISLASVNQTKVMENVYTFDVTGKVDCKVTGQAATQMYDVKGSFSVKQIAESFELTALATNPNLASAQ